jgi:cytoskeletal protein CcmA (bactofilin family)
MDDAESQDLAEAKSVSVIGANITITGNIEASGDPHLADLQIEGTVNGDVRCATVILTETSSVSGSIQAERVRVSGTVEGGIQTNDLAIEATARVSGDIVYERIRIAAGGMVQGTMKWKGAEPAETGRLKLVESSSDAPKAVWIE